MKGDDHAVGDRGTAVCTGYNVDGDTVTVTFDAPDGSEQSLGFDMPDEAAGLDALDCTAGSELACVKEEGGWALYDEPRIPAWRHAWYIDSGGSARFINIPRVMAAVFLTTAAAAIYMKIGAAPAVMAPWPAVPGMPWCDGAGKTL